MIKKLMIGLDASAHSRSAQAYAFNLAHRLRAMVIGLHVVDIVSIESSFLHDISGSLGLEPYLDFPSRMREVLTARGQTLLDEFMAHAVREKIQAEIRLDLGIVANQICERAKSADLLAVGHRGLNEKFSTGMLGHSAESVARKCPRPVLMTPMSYREIHRAVLAYDGSERASQAMRVAAELGSELDLPLTVVTVARDTKSGEKILDEARAYFDSHPAQAEFRLLRGHAPEEIVHFIKENDSDLAFIGAYGHSRILKMVLGSTTEYVLRNATCPLLLSR